MEPQAATKFAPIPYRIRLGVTGHRDIKEPVALEALVRKAIDAEVEGLFSQASMETLAKIRGGGVTETSFSVLSPLAEGADRIVARAVLGYAGARLDVVLPLTVEDYLEDFQTAESVAEFQELLGRCARPTVLRARPIRDEVHDPNDQSALRGAAYESVGRYVVDHCDVLIALWDGKPAQGRGGTAEIVEYAKAQKRPILVVWDGGWQIYDRGNGLDASGMEGIDQFNRFRSKPAECSGWESRHELKEFEELPGPTRELVDLYLRPYYAHASIMAGGNQARFYTAGKSIYSFSAAAVGCVAIAALFPVLAAPGFGAELVLLIMAVVALRRARRRHAHQTWVETRFLVERIRCGMFLAVCGVEPSPIEVLPFMGHAHTTNDWMVRVFEEIWQRLPRLSPCSKAECPLLNEFIRSAWIEGQIKYHQDKRKREKRARERLETAAKIVLPATIGAAALHLMLMGLLPRELPEWGHRVHQGLTFIGLLFPAVAASLAGMMAHREHLRLEKGSENILPYLESLDRRIRSAEEPAQFERLLHKVDELMLRETQGWLMLMRYVEIKAS